MRETLTYQADGLTMKSELFFEPKNGTRAGVLVYPEAYGLTVAKAKNRTAINPLALGIFGIEPPCFCGWRLR